MYVNCTYISFTIEIGYIVWTTSSQYSVIAFACYKFCKLVNTRKVYSYCVVHSI